MGGPTTTPSNQASRPIDRRAISAIAAALLKGLFVARQTVSAGRYRYGRAVRMQPIRLHTHEQPQHRQGCPTYRQSGACFPADDKLANRSRKSPLKIVNGRNAYRGPRGPFLESNEDGSIHRQRWQAKPTPMGSLGDRVRPNGKLGEERKERQGQDI